MKATHRNNAWFLKKGVLCLPGWSCRLAYPLLRPYICGWFTYNLQLNILQGGLWKHGAPQQWETAAAQPWQNNPCSDYKKYNHDGPVSACQFLQAKISHTSLLSVVFFFFLHFMIKILWQKLPASSQGKRFVWLLFFCKISLVLSLQEPELT